MRSCLIQLLILLVAVVFGLLWFGLPIGAGAGCATNALETRRVHRHRHERRRSRRTRRPCS